VWPRLTFAGAAVSGVAGRSLAGRCAVALQADGPSFPASIRLPVEADGKPNLMGLPWRPRPAPELPRSTGWVFPRNGRCRPPRYGIEAEWRKRALGVVPARPKARPVGQRHHLSHIFIREGEAS